MQNFKTTLKITGALMITIITWSSAFVAIRPGLKGYHPGSLALFRYLIASVCMYALFFCYSRNTKITAKELFLLCVLGLLGFTIYNIALNYGEISVPAGVTGFIISLVPLFVVILAILFLKEKLKPIQYIGIMISLIGIIVIAKGQHNGVHFDFGIIYNLIAALSGAIYVVLQKPLLRKFNPIELTTYSIWAGTVFMLIYSPQLFHDIQHAPTAATLSAVYLGIFPAALGYVCWSYVLVHFPASKASALLYTLPLIATLMGWLILSEVPTSLSLIGGIIALLGAILATVKRKVK